MAIRIVPAALRIASLRQARISLARETARRRGILGIHALANRNANFETSSENEQIVSHFNCYLIDIGGG